MGITEDFLNGLKKKKKQNGIAVGTGTSTKKYTATGANDLTTDFLEGLNSGVSQSEDIAPITNVTKSDDVAPVTSQPSLAELEYNYADANTRLSILKSYMNTGSLQDLPAHDSRYADLSEYALKDLTPAELRAKYEELSQEMRTAEDIYLKAKGDPTWFQPSALFEDGYDPWDVSKAILGSVSDLATNILGGLAEMPEKVVDAGAYLMPYLTAGIDMSTNPRKSSPSRLAMANATVEDHKEGASKFIAHDLYDGQAFIDNTLGAGFEAITGISPEEDSVFGKKTDSLAQSGGQLLGTMGLQAVGVPWWVTSGTTAFGSEAENALKQGATYEEAGGSALISAGAEILTEKLFKGSGLGEKGMIDLDPLTRGIANKTVRSLASYGVDMAAEGMEEVVTEVFSNLGSALYREEDLAEILASEEAIESYIDSFISGAALSGTMNVGKVASSVKKGTDYNTELSENEQAVVEKVYKEALFEAEQSGNVSATQKTKLWNEVIDMMTRGDISTSTIEKILGGETYQSYQDAVSNEDSLVKQKEALEKELKVLDAKKMSELTAGEADRRTELKEQIANLNAQIQSVQEGGQRGQLKTQLSEEVFKLVSGDRLSQSYVEQSKRGQAFTADLSKYDAKQATIIQKAIDSGILNDSRRTHEFVDFVARVAAEKGIDFDFTNNENLKKSGFAVDGKTVNGYYSNGTIGVNIDSPMAWQRTVGHEITHVLEGTDMYTTLQETLFEYAKTKGEYDTRLADLTEMYKGIKDADVQKELTADLVGDYLFTDRDFINNLSTQNRSLFDKVFDEIKYLCRVATAGSKQARELEKVKKAFEDAYRAGNNKGANTQYSISDSSGKQLTPEQQEFFKDSKMRDDAGNLMVMYHGSPESFTVFDKKKAKSSGYYGSGFYFTNSGSHANQYGNAYEVYLNITNPLQDGTNDITKDQIRRFVEAIAENEDYGIDNYGYGATVDSVTDSVYGKSDFAMLMDINASCVGDMVKAIELFNEVNGTDYNGIIAPTETVAFYPEQIKSVGNKTPTSNPDIRFSLSETVEETRDLIAVHNLTGEKLIKSLRLGGLPMPSIAIVKAQDGHGEFGEISLVFPKETIDPNASRKNKLYSGDAWTPMYPSVDYKLNGKALKNIRDKIDGLVPPEVQEFGRLALDADNMEDILNRYGGNVVDAFKDNDALKYAYLVEAGADITLPMKDKNLSHYGSRENGEIIKVAEALSVDEISRALNGGREEVEKLEPIVRKAVAEYVRETYGDDQFVLDTFAPESGIPFSSLDGYLTDARKYHRTGIEQTVDPKPARQMIQDMTVQYSYEEWLQSLFSGIVEKEGIRNNQDYFTPSGNRRSFEALHYEHNLENVVRAMRKQGEKGIGNGFGGASIFGASTTEFSSVEEMKQSSDRLQTMSYEEYQELREGFTNRFLEIAMRLPNQKNDFFATDSAAEVLTEAVAKYNTRSGIANYLRRELSGWATYSDQVVDDLIELVNDIRKMPTRYFESKPQRAVGFEEVGVFVIPYNAAPELKQELLNRGYSIAEYDPNVEGDRQRVVNQFEEYKFSLSNVGDQTSYGNYSTPATDLRLEQIAPVAENVTEGTAEGAPVEEDAPVAGKTTSPALYNGRDGEKGWGKVYATAQEALNDAVQSVNPGLWDAITEELENSVDVKNPDTPMINALIAVQEDVRQSTITPMQGAQLLSEAYGIGGAKALRGLYNPKTGNLYNRYLEKAKQHENVAPATEMFPDDIAPVDETAEQERLASLNDTDAPPEADTYYGEEDAPIMEQQTPAEEAYEAIRPEPSKEPRMKRKDSKGKQRKWVGTSTESDAVDGKVLPEDLDQDVIHYQPISNRKTLGNANAKLESMGYEAAVVYMNSQFASNKVTLDDIALGERLIQEAVKRGDTKTAGDLIMDISILGTELGQKVQALSIIKRLTPEGQLRMLQRTVERGKNKGDKAFEGVEITQDMIDYILKTYADDGSFDPAELTERVEVVKQQIADQMKVGVMDYINSWRYLAMLGNPKTHIRNLVSNVAMLGTRQVKNALARTIEDIAPIKSHTKTCKKASDAVKAYAEQVANEEFDGNTDNKYSDGGNIKAKRKIFKTKAVEWMSNANSTALSAEDQWFSKPAFRSAFSEYLTANGIVTDEDIKNNPKIVAAAKQYAMKQAQEATFQQDSYIASKISEIERKNPVTNIAIGSVLPFKKTPINIAKTALAYSPLGFARNIYDAVQVSKGNMDASEAIDHFAQTLTGTSLTLIGYALASMGILNGAGEDDKEGEYDYQLGEQSYSLNFNGETFSLSWLSPVAMPLFVGANAYEQFVEKRDWNGNVVTEALAQTLDPLSEMSFLSSLNSVLSSYDSGMAAFGGMLESAGQSYVTSFVPTLFSQVAQVTDDVKRSTKVSANSGWDFGEETWNKIKYKIPGLRQTLEPSTDIWGNEVKQTENDLAKAFETFIAPYARREDIATAVDEEIKDLYRQTGDGKVIPSIPDNYVNYKGEKYDMSAEEFTNFKKVYGQTAFDLMEQLFDTETYRNADSATRADMVNRVYDYARDLARKDYFAKQGVEFTNATEDKKDVYKENPIKGAIESDMTVDEYVFSKDYPEKYKFLNANGVTYDDYANGSEEFKDAWTWASKNPEKFTLSKAVSSDVVTYRQYTKDLYDIKADKDSYGNSISGSRKEKVIDYINNMDADYGEKIILFKSEYPADDTYNWDIIDYLNSREDISYEEMETILKELGFKVSSDGYITWD
jgi:hypothetical protein